MKQKTKENLTYTGLTGLGLYVFGTTLLGLGVIAYPVIQLARNIAR
jgi:hypothetical protein